MGFNWEDEDRHALRLVLFSGGGKASAGVGLLVEGLISSGLELVNERSGFCEAEWLSSSNVFFIACSSLLDVMSAVSLRFLLDAINSGLLTIFVLGRALPFGFGRHGLQTTGVNEFLCEYLASSKVASQFVLRM